MNCFVSGSYARLIGDISLTHRFRDWGALAFAFLLLRGSLGGWIISIQVAAVMEQSEIRFPRSSCIPRLSEIWRNSKHRFQTQKERGRWEMPFTWRLFTLFAFPVQCHSIYPPLRLCTYFSRLQLDLQRICNTLFTHTHTYDEEKQSCILRSISKSLVRTKYSKTYSNVQQHVTHRRFG